METVRYEKFLIRILGPCLVKKFFYYYVLWLVRSIQLYDLMFLYFNSIKIIVEHLVT